MFLIRGNGVVRTELEACMWHIQEEVEVINCDHHATIAKAPDTVPKLSRQTKKRRIDSVLSGTISMLAFFLTRKPHRHLHINICCLHRLNTLASFRHFRSLGLFGHESCWHCALLGGFGVHGCGRGWEFWKSNGGICAGVVLKSDRRVKWWSEGVVAK